MCGASEVHASVAKMLGGKDLSQVGMNYSSPTKSVQKHFINMVSAIYEMEEQGHRNGNIDQIKSLFPAHNIKERSGQPDQGIESFLAPNLKVAYAKLKVLMTAHFHERDLSQVGARKLTVRSDSVMAVNPFGLKKGKKQERNNTFITNLYRDHFKFELNGELDINCVYGGKSETLLNG